MAMSKILLLSLIALSCFQMQNARVIPDDISDDFNEALETLNKSLVAKVEKAVTIIGEVEQQVLLIAILDLDVYHKDMDELEINANSELDALSISETCRNKAAAALVKLRPEINSNVDACFGALKEENEKVADLGRNVLLGEFLGYPDRLLEQFKNCADDDCRKETLKEANTAIEQAQEEVWKVMAETLEAQEQLMIKFEEECLIKSEQDYQEKATAVIEEAKTCVDFYL